jgi:hypothetical protein
MQKVWLFVVLFLPLLGNRPANAQGAKKPPAPATSPAKSAQAAYAARVQIIVRELNPRLATLWLTYDQLETRRTEQAKRHKSGVDEAEAKAELVRLRTTLLDTIKAIRVNARRLRSLSPVPQSLRKADDDLIDFGFEVEIGLDSLVTWIDTPAPEMSLQASRQLRKAITSLASALSRLGRLTDPAVKGKIYIEG